MQGQNRMPLRECQEQQTATLSELSLLLFAVGAGIKALSMPEFVSDHCSTMPLGLWQSSELTVEWRPDHHQGLLERVTLSVLA